MWIYNQVNELYHFGVKGQKWGVRRYQNRDGSLTPAGLKRYSPSPGDTSVTVKVKKDLANLSPQEFKNKYKGSASTYMKRVDKYGDPYANSPSAKKAMRSAEKELNSKGNKAGKKVTTLQKQIDSFDGLENGIYDKKGRPILSKEDVSLSVSALKTQQQKYEKQVNTMIKNYSKNYDLYHDPSSGNIRLAPKK